MSNCFCHLNGFEVKDKEARTAISNMNNRLTTAEGYITDVEERVTTLEGAGNSGGSGGSLKRVVYQINGATSTVTYKVTLPIYLTSATPTTYDELANWLYTGFKGATIPASGTLVKNSSTIYIACLNMDTWGIITIKGTEGTSAAISSGSGGSPNITSFTYVETEV